MRVIYMYHEREPQRGSVIAGNLPDPGGAFRGYRSLFLTQTPTAGDGDGDDETTASSSSSSEGDSDAAAASTLELRNVDVELPQGGDTLYWCKMFKLKDIGQKSHVIKVQVHTLNTHTHTHTQTHVDQKVADARAPNVNQRDCTHYTIR